MPVKRLKEFLDSQKVKYVSIIHSPAYTTQQIAASAHISGKNVAKVVIVKVDNKLAMVVLPAPSMVDFDTLKKTTGAKEVRLATEEEFRVLFPDCDVGAMPPFGNLYDMEVFVLEGLEKDEEIAFNAGSHSELIKLSYQDFERLVKPRAIKSPH